jgi:hypothetical protein
VQAVNLVIPAPIVGRGHLAARLDEADDVVTPARHASMQWPGADKQRENDSYKQQRSTQTSEPG